MKRYLPTKKRKHIKRRGLLAILLQIGFLMFGLAFGLPEYFIIVAALAILLLIALLQAIKQIPLFKITIATTTMLRTVAATAVFDVANPCTWPFFPLRFALFLQKEGHEPVELTAMEIMLKPKEKKSFTIEVICPHRGEYTIFLQQYYAEDMFGFFAFPNPTLSSQSLLSLPKSDFSIIVDSDNAMFEGEETPLTWQGQQGDLTAESRLFQQGDSMRIINWKKSTSRRELYSRLKEQTTDYSCCLLIDNRPHGEGEESLDYEDCLCEAALCFLFAELAHNKSIMLRPGGITLHTAQGLNRAAELLAALPFAAETIFGELMSLLELPQPPTKLYIAMAASPEPLLPLLEQLIHRGSQVTVITPSAYATQVESEIKLAIPLLYIDPPSEVLSRQG
ncbi:MAG: DUF58 domain-containing protein [Clostridiales bacterium]|nr:DUF58 domain-containing protein [Clostridiales bacterium]